MAVGSVGCVLFLLAFAVQVGFLLHGDPVLLGVVGSTAGGFVGIGAFAAAYGLRMRSLHSFGFTRALSSGFVIADSTVIHYKKFCMRRRRAGNTVLVVLDRGRDPDDLR